MRGEGTPWDDAADDLELGADEPDESDELDELDDQARWADLGDGLPLDFNLGGGRPGALAPLPARRPQDFYVLTPGDDVVVMPSLPKRRHLPTAFVVTTGVLGLFDRTGRVWCRTPQGGATEHPDEPLATHLALAVVRRPQVDPAALDPTFRRGAGTAEVPDRPRFRRDRSSHRYLIALDRDRTPVGALDNRPPEWELMPRRIAQMAESVGVTFSAERFYSNEEFASAHPDWLE